MRLTPFEIQVIEDTIHSLDPDASVYVFGSRANDNLKGGDIDLLIFSKRLTFLDKIKIKKRLFDSIEEQKIDLIIAQNDADPFVRLALEHGVRLG